MQLYTLYVVYLLINKYITTMQISVTIQNLMKISVTIQNLMKISVTIQNLMIVIIKKKK